MTESANNVGTNESDEIQIEDAPNSESQLEEYPRWSEEDNRVCRDRREYINDHFSEQVDPEIRAFSVNLVGTNEDECIIELAMRALYLCDRLFAVKGDLLSSQEKTEIIKSVLADVLGDIENPLIALAASVLVWQTARDQERIDSQIVSHITCDWTFERLARIERSLLRLGASIIDHPTYVSVNPALAIVSRLARLYAADRAAILVNGILKAINYDRVKTIIENKRAAKAKKLQQAQEKEPEVNSVDEPTVASEELSDKEA